ncbi:MAG: LolA-like putative outer membrane lipoprotein chaperone [Dysgonomonas sp.]
MKIRLLVFSFISFFCIQNSSSQNAKEILDKVSSIYSDNAGFEINFTLNTEDVPNKTTYTHDGKAYIKGNKFKIDVPDGVTWFDGKTQWMYLSGNDEVNVTNPTNEELMSISPIVLLNMYKTGFKLVDKGTVTEKGKQLSVIEMIPQKKRE